MIFSAKWLLTSAAAVALGFILTRWFGLALWKVALVGIATAALAFAFPASPAIAFSAASVGLSIVLAREGGELGDWFASSWGFAKQIVPLLFAGVLVAGLLLGRPGHEGLIPSEWITSALGGNSLRATAFASVAGALMYFATLTEVPILQGLMGAGMGKGPALALLLAGPALSLPAMLVLAGIMGWRKTLTYVGLIAVAATIAGMIYGAIG